MRLKATIRKAYSISVMVGEQSVNVLEEAEPQRMGEHLTLWKGRPVGRRNPNEEAHLVTLRGAELMVLLGDMLGELEDEPVVAMSASLVQKLGLADGVQIGSARYVLGDLLRAVTSAGETEVTGGRLFTMNLERLRDQLTELLRASGIDPDGHPAGAGETLAS